jgi:uracil-DNA glycosylase family 4
VSLYDTRLAIAHGRPRPKICDGCIGNPETVGHNPLYSGAFIPPTEEKNPHLLVVGACGGVEEEEDGIPLVGVAGRKLRRALDWAAGNRRLVYQRWNVYNCRATRPSDTGKPFVVNRKPNKLQVKELRDCASRWLFPALRKTKAKVVLILGVDMHNFIMGQMFDTFHRAMGHRMLVPQKNIRKHGLGNEIVSYGKVYELYKDGEDR